MLNAENLEEAIRQLQREAQRDSTALQQEELALRVCEAEKAALETKIKQMGDEIRQKENEIRQLKTDISKAHSDISAHEATKRTLVPKIDHLKKEAKERHDELTHATMGYQEALRHSGVKDIKSLKFK